MKNIDITRYLYNKSESSFYDDTHIEPIIEQFQLFFKKRIEKLKHTDFITLWIQNMDTATHLEQLKKVYVPSNKK